MEETKEMVREGTLPGRRRSEGSVVASAMWGAGILVSIAIIAGATAISFAILRGEMFGVVGSEKQAVIEEKTKEPSAKNVPPAQAPTPPEERVTGSTTLGTAPILGNMKTAKVAIIEWSDLECPFCKKFHDDTFDNIVKDYVDTGKAVFSFRDYPLDFHGEAAIKEANAARCVREAAGDKAYFAFIKDVYANTGTNGKGIPDEELGSLADAAAKKSVATCMKNLKFKDAIDADLAAGTDAGITGTPGFIVGKIGKDGAVQGAIISGAMPYAEFKKAIDAAIGS